MVEYLDDYLREPLIKQENKDPIRVHYTRLLFPGYYNRGHRKAIDRAWVKFLLDEIANVNPFDTPWVSQIPKITAFSWMGQWPQNIVPNVKVTQD